MNFKIKDTVPLDHNTLKGRFTLQVGPLEIEGYTYHVQGEKSWVNPPSREYTDKESGERKFAPIVRIPEKDRYWTFQKWAIEQVEDVFAKQSEPAVQPAEDQGDGDAPF